MPPRRPKTPSTSPTRSKVLPASPGSPARKVVTDFAAFGASPTTSIFGTKVTPSPFSLAGGTAAFGGVRGAPRSSSFDADDDEEEEPEDDGKQRVDLKEGSISYDQVCLCFLLKSRC